ncbi:MAG: EamA family transporter [Candidatus Micrarchaeia archaeon]
MAEWVYYALAAMLLLSVSNIALKLLSRDYALPKSPDWAYVGLAFVGLAVLAFAAANLLVLTGEQLKFAAVVAVFSLTGFALVYLALQKGKVAVVTAVLSLGTVVVALLSIQFLGDKFSAKEALALIFAMLATLLLVI